MTTTFSMSLAHQTVSLFCLRLGIATLSDYYSDNEHPNGLDFKDVNKIARYHEAITKLQRRCEFLLQNNERLVISNAKFGITIRKKH